MACLVPFDAFRLATESLGEDLYLRASAQDVMLNLVPRGVYKKGTGLTQSVFTVERSEPTEDEETWTTIQLSDAGTYTGSCGITYNPVEYGMTEGTYSPEQFGLSGPTICQDDLIYNFKAEEFLEKYLMQLEIRNKRSVTNRLLKRYIDLVPKTVAGPSAPTYTQTSLILPQAACQLDQEMLDQVALELIENGSTNPNSNGWIEMGDQGPLFMLLIGPEMSSKVWKDNAEIRQDYRYAGPLELIKRVGAKRTIGNFRHIPWLFPARYNYAGGAYVRVNTWVMNSKTKGKGAEINPLWRSASHEAALVLNPWVMHEEIVLPVNSAAGLTFPEKNYFGEWKFVVGGREITPDGSCFDPTKKLGKHFAEYKHALKPIFTQYGRWIIYRRCANELPCASCS